MYVIIEYNSTLDIINLVCTYGRDETAVFDTYAEAETEAIENVILITQ